MNPQYLVFTAIKLQFWLTNHLFQIYARDTRYLRARIKTFFYGFHDRIKTIHL